MFTLLNANKQCRPNKACCTIVGGVLEKYMAVRECARVKLRARRCVSLIWDFCPFDYYVQTSSRTTVFSRVLSLYGEEWRVARKPPNTKRKHWIWSGFLHS